MENIFFFSPLHLNFIFLVLWINTKHDFIITLKMFKQKSTNYILRLAFLIQGIEIVFQKQEILLKKEIEPILIWGPQ